MRYHTVALGMLVAAGLALPSVAFASDSEPGAYLALRAGRTLDSDLKIDPARLRAPGAITASADGKAGWQGEAALGYDFGGARLELALGTGRSKIDRSTPAALASFNPGGKFNKTDVMLNGYVDLIPEAVITPYVGLGIGAARISGDFSRTGPLPIGISPTTVKSGGWAFAYQGMAGLRYRASENLSLDLGLRHQRTGNVNLRAALAGPVGSQVYPARFTSTSVLLGATVKF